jgi:hypothetical protein
MTQLLVYRTALRADAGRLARHESYGFEAFLACVDRHVRIEAGCAITSVRPKSPPLNNSGARSTAETAYAKQSPKFSLAGCPLPRPNVAKACEAALAMSRLKGTTESPGRSTKA